jgi:hypothetical protein
MDRQIIGFRSHFALRIARQDQVDRGPMHPQIHQALDGFLAQHRCRTDEDDGRPKREGETFGIKERGTDSSLIEIHLQSFNPEQKSLYGATVSVIEAISLCGQFRGELHRL